MFAASPALALLAVVPSTSRPSTWIGRRGRGHVSAGLRGLRLGVKGGRRPRSPSVDERRRGTCSSSGASRRGIPRAPGQPHAGRAPPGRDPRPEAKRAARGRCGSAACPRGRGRRRGRPRRAGHAPSCTRAGARRALQRRALLLWVETRPTPRGASWPTRSSSARDGGTPPIASWPLGRVTDIELVYEVELDAGGGSSARLSRGATT